ncbi:hypothetical protein [Nocardia harenae]|uniref:hypothetical protein n=1 Tax=Nocardia harenae TaxID=358707 RepID=UPI000829784B|nr:hypothetical protein [Nocardia harenae]
MRSRRKRGRVPAWFARLDPDAKLALLDDPYRELTEPLVTALGADAEYVVGRVYTAHERSTRYYLAPRAAVELVTTRDRLRRRYRTRSPLHRLLLRNRRGARRRRRPARKGEALLERAAHSCHPPRKC